MIVIVQDSQVKLIIVRDDRVVRSSRRDQSRRWTAIVAVFNQEFPLVGGMLKRIKIECNEIVKEETLNLTAKDVDLRSQNVQCVSVSSCGEGTGRNGTRPLSIGCDSSISRWRGQILR
jgi:hypothetical protein